MNALKPNRSILFTACMVLAGAFCSPACSGQQVIPGTALSVRLPPGWSIGPENAKGPNRIDHLNYKGDPAFAIYVTQNTNPMKGAMGLPFECDFMFGALVEMKDAKGEAMSVAELRPDYFPSDFFSWVLKPKPVEKRLMLVGCLFLGSTNIGVQIWPEPKPEDSPKVGAMLKAIVEAGRAKSSLVYGPGDLMLSIDRVNVRLTEGIWGVGLVKAPSGGNQLDLLVRTGGEAELKVMPLPQTGSCSTEMRRFENQKTSISGGGSGTTKRKPPYFTSNWYPVVFESAPANSPFHEALVLGCRQLTPTTLLLVTIQYGRKEIPERDAPIVAKTMDEIADAILRGPKGDGVIYSPPLAATAPGAVTPH